MDRAQKWNEKAAFTRLSMNNIAKHVSAEKNKIFHFPLIAGNAHFQYLSQNQDLLGLCVSFIGVN